MKLKILLINLLTSCIACSTPDEKYSLIGTWNNSSENSVLTWHFEDETNMKIKTSNQTTYTAATYTYAYDSLHIYGMGVGNSYQLYFSGNSSFMTSRIVFGDTLHWYFTKQ